MNQPVPYTFTVSSLNTSVYAIVYSTSQRLLTSRAYVTVIVGHQGSWSRGTSGDFHSRDEGRHCECYDVLSIRAEENPASWSSVDIVSQYNEETLDFFTNGYNDSYIIQ
jgi:hypothetical protein